MRLHSNLSLLDALNVLPSQFFPSSLFHLIFFSFFFVLPSQNSTQCIDITKCIAITIFVLHFSTFQFFFVLQSQNSTQYIAITKYIAITSSPKNIQNNQKCIQFIPYHWLNTQCIAITKFIITSSLDLFVHFFVKCKHFWTLKLPSQNSPSPHLITQCNCSFFYTFEL